MAMSADDVLKMLKEKEVKFVDLRFNMDKFESGHFFDGSSIAGWKSIEASDMLLTPDPDSARMDPFTDEPVLNLTCDVTEPLDGRGYDRDPRTIAKRAEAFMQSTGLGDEAYFGPEPEFFIFDSVTWNIDAS
jgi:glutamine synthetase